MIIELDPKRLFAAAFLLETAMFQCSNLYLNSKHIRAVSFIAATPQRFRQIHFIDSLYTRSSQQKRQVSRTRQNDQKRPK